jgi:heptosyltransferase-2
MKILIELPSWLGDTIMSTPAIENIINFFDDSQVTLIGSNISIQVFQGHPNVLKKVILDKNYFGLYKTIREFDRFDVFFSFRKSYRSKFLKFFITADSKYQFDGNKFKIGHQVEKYNDFINRSLKIRTIPSNLVLNNFYTKIKSKKKLLGINPGSKYGLAKRWHPKKFAQVATKLSMYFDVIIFGSSDEVKICSDIEKYLVENNVKNYQNKAGKTSILELINKIQTLDLFITGDSGSMHIAAAFKIPTVSIFGPTNAFETSQWMNEKSIIVKKKLDCQPCMRRTCPLRHNNCMKLISSKEVLEAANKLV